MKTRKDKRILLKSRRKLRKFRVILTFFLLTFIIICGYTITQYFIGKNHSDISLNKKDLEFNGQKSNQGKINVLLIGADNRKEGEASNSDSIIIAQYDPDKNKAKLISLMRDMYVSIPGYGERKINASYLLGGPELLRETIKSNFDIDLQYYLLVDFKGFENAVDAIAPNGIAIDVEKSMSREIGVSLQKGLHNLNGKELLGYARFRKDAESDFGRVRRQQQVIKAVSNELISTNGIVKAPKLLGTIQPYIQTNIGKMDSLSLIKEFMFFDTKNINTMTVPIKGSFDEERLQDKYRTSILRTDFEMNALAIEKFLER